MPDHDPLQLFKLRDVAGLIGVSTMTIRRYVKSGALESIKIGGQLRFTHRQVADFVKRSEKKTKAQRKEKP